MAYIELVIKIPEEMYEWVNDVNRFFDDYGISDFIDLVKNGTPLPKGHDRLIEAREVINAMFAGKTIDDVPTIIEADKEE